MHNDFIADVCGLLCEKMRSAPGTVDSFTFKVWTWFHAELQHCAETGVVPYNLHAIMADVNDAWVVDSQYVEGCNGVLKKIVTHAPSINLALISTRTTVKRMLGLSGGRKANHHIVMTCDAGQPRKNKQKHARQGTMTQHSGCAWTALSMTRVGGQC